MKKILGLILALMITVPSFASLGISPTKLEINANKVRANYFTTAIDVKGDINTPMRFKVYPGYFTINSNGEVVMIEKSNGDAHDISKKIRYVPSEFTIIPGRSQKLRINIPNIKELADGESRAILYIEDINPKEINLDTGRTGIGAQLIVKTRVGVPILVDKGKFTKKGEIEYFNIKKEKDGIYTEMKIVSTGNSRIGYTGKYQIIKGKELIDEYEMERKTVGDNNFYVAKEKLKTDKIKGVGEYTIKAVLSYHDENGKKKNLTKETILKIQGEM